MELVTVHDTKYELVELFIDGDLYGGESSLSELALPAGFKHHHDSAER